MSRPRQYHTRQTKAIQRRRHTAAMRRQRDCRQAQQAAEALQQALEDLGLPDNVVAEIEGRLHSRDKLHWLQSMLDGRVAACRRRGVAMPPPLVVVDSWFSNSKLMRHVATTHQGTFLVEGKSIYVFDLPDGRQVKGHDLQQGREWPWRSREQVPGVRYARLRATRPT